MHGSFLRYHGGIGCWPSKGGRMDGYVSLCSGTEGNPPGVVFDRMRKRRRALSGMMRDRSSVRYLVAPHGYGKSTVAFDYASSIYAPERAWWVDAGDPRFLRDLDARRLSTALLRRSDGRACLAVFDDLPYLDAERAEAFSDVCGALLRKGWEVVATALPANDRSKALDSEVTLLGPDDLALDEEEASGLSLKRFSRWVPHWRHVPSMAWGSPSTKSRFARQVLSEPLPRDLSLAVMAALLLQRGSIESAAIACGLSSSAPFRDLEAVHTYLGIDVRSGFFEACDLDVGDLSGALLAKLSAVLPEGALGVDEWALRMADLLLAEGRPDRACETVGALCSTPARAAWLSGRQQRLAHEGCFLAACRLESTLPSLDGDMRAWAAWRMAVLGREGSSSEAMAALRDPETSSHGRLLACLVLMGSSSPDEVGEAVAVAGRLAFGGEARPVDPAGVGAAACREAMVSNRSEVEGNGRFALARISWLALVRVDLAGGSADALARACVQAGAALRVGGRWMVELAAFMLLEGFRSFARLSDAGVLSERGRCIEQELAGSVVSLLRSCDPSGSDVGYPIAALVEESGASARDLAESGVSARLLGRVEGMVERLRSQRACDGERTRDREPAARLREAPANPASSSCGIPPLRIELFGGVTVHVGSQRVDAPALRRQSVRTLLAMLALARGREVSVERIERTLWPDSTPERARNNFYSSWSHLRRALALGSGECPYLARYQRSCRLDAMLSTSDVGDLEDLCSRTGEGDVGPDEAMAMLRRADSLYRGELMPGESTNAVVVRHRSEIRSRFVDAAVRTSGRLLERDPAAALEAARMAMAHAGSREDAYEALMQAQAAMGQRTSAMASFMECRRMLNEDLGIDPSSRLSSLYESLLGEDDSGTGQMRLPI